MAPNLFRTADERRDAGIRQSARGIASCGTQLDEEGNPVYWTIRGGLYREVTYAPRACTTCGNMLPACDDPTPTHLCVPAADLARARERAEVISRAATLRHYAREARLADREGVIR